MSPDSSQVREFFDAHTGAWDQMHESFYDEKVVDALAERCALDEHDHGLVVDVGTGTGFVAGGLAGRVARVTGADTSTGMLDQARTNLQGLGITNVELVEAPADRLPLGDATQGLGIVDLAVM